MNRITTRTGIAMEQVAPCEWDFWEGNRVIGTVSGLEAYKTWKLLQYQSMHSSDQFRYECPESVYESHTQQARVSVYTPPSSLRARISKANCHGTRLHLERDDWPIGSGMLRDLPFNQGWDPDDPASLVTRDLDEARSRFRLPFSFGLLSNHPQGDVLGVMHSSRVLSDIVGFEKVGSRFQLFNVPTEIEAYRGRIVFAQAFGGDRPEKLGPTEQSQRDWDGCKSSLNDVEQPFIMRRENDYVKLLEERYSDTLIRQMVEAEALCDNV